MTITKDQQSVAELNLEQRTHVEIVKRAFQQALYKNFCDIIPSEHLNKAIDSSIEESVLLHFSYLQQQLGFVLTTRQADFAYNNVNTILGSLLRDFNSQSMDKIEKMDLIRTSSEHTSRLRECQHLQWIYDRMSEVHNENENVDYMVKFRSIIEDLSKSSSK